MQSSLLPQHIKELAQAAFGTERSAIASHSVQPCKFPAAGNLDEQQVSVLQNVGQEFARNMTQTAQAYLGNAFQLTPVLSGQLHAEEFSKSAELDYLVSLDIAGRAAGILIVDRTLVFPIVDMLLGGMGMPNEESLAITDVEAHIMLGMVRIICDELQTVWKPGRVEICPGARLQVAQLRGFLSANEELLSLKFDVETAKVSGKLMMILPAGLLDGIQDKPKTASGMNKPDAATEGERLRDRLMECRFAVELAIPHIKAKVAEVFALAPGKVLNLHLPVTHPVSLMIAGRQVFEAAPARRGTLRAVQIIRRIPQSELQREI